MSTSDTAPRLWSAEAVEIARTVAWALLIALVLRVLLFQPFTIPSDSMEPGLRNGDYIVVSKFDYGWSRHSIPLSPPLFKARVFARTPKRGDVIVFKLPRDPSVDYIKRLIGLPGDRVQVLGGAVFVNGRAIPRTPLSEIRDPDNPLRTVQPVRESLPDHPGYVTFAETPDARSENTDVYVVPQGGYFFMGDNRDNSSDSRWPSSVGVGFVPAENLEGKARIILLSWRGAALARPWTWLTRLDLSRCFRPVV